MTKLPTLTPRAARRSLTTLLLAAACAASGLANAAKGAAKPSYEYYATGNPQATVTLPTSYATTSLVLMGGGPDVDEAFRWMITRAGIKPGTGGRFVVIRATGTDAYDPYLYYSDASLSTSTTVADQWVGGASLGLTSAETLVIPSVAAAKLASKARGVLEGLKVLNGDIASNIDKTYALVQQGYADFAAAHKTQPAPEAASAS